MNLSEAWHRTGIFFVKSLSTLYSANKFSVEIFFTSGSFIPLKISSVFGSGTAIISYKACNLLCSDCVGASFIRLLETFA